MSYNVDDVKILTGELWLSREGRAWLEREVLTDEAEEDSCLPESMPECESLLDSIMAIGRDGLTDEQIAHAVDLGLVPGQPETMAGYRRLKNIWWGGEGSGNAVERGAFRKLLSFTKGSADILLTWEGGDSFSGYRVVDGVVTRHMVEMNLGEEVDE